MAKAKIDEATAILMATAAILVKYGISPAEFIERLATLSAFFEINHEKLLQTWELAIQKNLILRQAMEVN